MKTVEIKIKIGTEENKVLEAEAKLSRISLPVYIRKLLEEFAGYYKEEKETAQRLINDSSNK